MPVGVIVLGKGGGGGGQLFKLSKKTSQKGECPKTFATDCRLLILRFTTQCSCALKVIPRYCTAHPVLRIRCVNIYKLVKFVTL